jgi:hypothetical protein
MYLKIKVLFFLLNIPSIFTFILWRKQFVKNFECVADYLLFSKNLQTEIFAENIEGNWIIERGISEKFLKNILIEKKEMGNFMGEKYSNYCFDKINKLNWIEKNKIKIEDILNLIKEKYLILSENVQKKLGKFLIIFKRKFKK